MTPKERAYLAGIIDGEGTVTLSRGHINEMPSPKVSVANNSVPLLNWIKIKTGTGVIIRRSKRAPQHGSQYVLDVCDNAALKLLDEIKEFLIVKKKHAEILVSRYKSVTPRNGRYTEEQRAKKMELVAEIRSLNRH